MLAIKNINKTFNKKQILDNVSFTMQRGDIVILLGESGVGKSTMLRVLCNLETVDSGTITFNGKKLDPLTLNKKHIIGMVFQQFNLFEHMTVEQNITFPLEKVLNQSKQTAQDNARSLLKQYGLLDKANKYVSQLSGGQKQRLAIARTLALKPYIICLDEPTSALDPLLTTHVAKNIQELSDEGYIILVASHDTVLLKKLTCTIHLMKDGRIIESATSNNFSRTPENYPFIKQFVAGIPE